jgi:hypothetical protein
VEEIFSTDECGKKVLQCAALKVLRSVAGGFRRAGLFRFFPFH